MEDLLGKGTVGGRCSGDPKEATLGGEGIPRLGPSCMSSNARPGTRTCPCSPQGQEEVLGRRKQSDVGVGVESG